MQMFHFFPLDLPLSLFSSSLSVFIICMLYQQWQVITKTTAKQKILSNNLLAAYSYFHSSFKYKQKPYDPGSLLAHTDQISVFRSPFTLVIHLGQRSLSGEFIWRSREWLLVMKMELELLCYHQPVKVSRSLYVTQGFRSILKSLARFCVVVFTLYRNPFKLLNV